MATKKKTEFYLKIVETEKGNMSADFKANGSKLSMNIFFLNAMSQNEVLANILQEAVDTFRDFKKAQKKKK